MQTQELQNRKSNWPSPDDKAIFVLFGRPSIDGVAPDSKGFHQGELLVGKVVTLVELSGGQKETGSHPSVGVDSQNLEVFTAIAVSFFARKALLTIDIGLHATPVAGF